MRIPIALAALGSVALLALVACDRETTTQARKQAEGVGQKVDQALDRTQDKLAAAGEKTQQKLAETGEKVAATVKDAATSASLGDAAITASIKADFLKDPDLSVLKIDVDTRDGVVTLNGLAENEAARRRAEQLAGAIKGVKEVRNYLTVKRG